MSELKITLDEKLLEKLILNYFQEKLGDINIELKDITIEVKSKQNFKSEWERANFRAVVEKFL